MSNLKNIQLLQKTILLLPFWMKNIVISLYSFLMSKEKYGRRYYYWRKLLEESQYWTEDKLLTYRTDLLKKFIKSSVCYSPFYKKITDELAIDVDQIENLCFIKKFPIINKQIVRNNYNEIQNNSMRSKKYKMTTSGTTGMSLSVFLDKEAFEREIAFRWQFYSIAKAKENSKFAYLLGNRFIPASHNKPPFYLVDYYKNAIYFSIFHMSENSLKSYVTAFNRFKPEFVKGYPSGLYEFARYIDAKKMIIHKPEAVFSASEVLYDFQKDIIEKAFGAPVFQWYGQVETTINIHQCEKGRLHVKEEYGLLEIIKHDGSDAVPGEIGKAIGTGWGNNAFPLIRYDTGDMMQLAYNQNCDCGRNGRIIERIIGRDEDVILTPEGKKIGRLDFVFKPVSSVKESRIVQETKDMIKIQIVPFKDFNKKDESLIINKLKDYIGESFSINIEIIDSIPREKSGKIKYVVSKIKEN